MNNHTLLWKMMALTNFTRLISNIYFKKKNINHGKMFKMKEIMSLIGIITRIENAQKVPIGSEIMLSIQTKSNLRSDNLQPFVPVILLPRPYRFSFVAPYAFSNGHLPYQNEIAFTSKTYKFLDRAISPCVAISVMEDCYLKCYLDQINALKFTCQLPFLPKTSDIECTANKKACDYLRDIGKIRHILNPPFDCNCSRECDKTVLAYNFNYDNHLLNTFLFYPISNWIRSLEEYYCYDFIALLCDIGGFLSLYTGLSCISLVEYMHVNILQTFKKLYFTSRLSKSEKNIIIKIENIRLSCKMKVKDKLDLNYIKHIKMGFLTILFILSCFTIAHRIMFYISYPVYITIELAQDRYVHIPNMVFCSEDYNLYKIKVDHRIECIKNLDILDLLTKYENNTEKLWEATNDFDSYAFGKKLLEKITSNETALIYPNFGFLSKLDTVFGRCVKVESNVREFNPVTAVMYVLNPIFLESQKFCSNMNTKVIKMNTPVNPCTSSKIFDLCEENCYTSKLKTENIQCRLPFFNSTDLPACKTIDSAKLARESYLKVYENTDAVYHCKCHPPCNFSSYTYMTHNSYYATANNTVLTFTRSEFDSNIREIFKEELSMPIVKLLCDVGSLLGFLLGLSILLCFQLFEKFLKSIATKF